MGRLAEDLKSAEEVTGEAVAEVNRLTEYVQTHVSALIGFGVKIVLVLIFFFVGRAVIRWIRKVVRHSMEHANADKGVVSFIDSLLKFSLYALLIFTIATKLGVESSSIAALIASAGVAIGLALQGSLSNFAGGVLILLLKPFVVGDYIIENAGGSEGTVTEIQIFYTKLSTLDNKTIVIPNGTLSNASLTNVTASPKRQLDLKVGIAYHADLTEAKEVLWELLKKEPGIFQEEPMNVFVDSLSDSAVMLGVRAWVKTEEYWPVRWSLLENIKLKFDEEGIEIPYNQITVHMRKAPER